MPFRRRRHRLFRRRHTKPLPQHQIVPVPRWPGYEIPCPWHGVLLAPAEVVEMSLRTPCPVCRAVRFQRCWNWQAENPVPLPDGKVHELRTVRARRTQCTCTDISDVTKA